MGNIVIKDMQNYAYRKLSKLNKQNYLNLITTLKQD